MRLICFLILFLFMAGQQIFAQLYPYQLVAEAGTCLGTDAEAGPGSTVSLHLRRTSTRKGNVSCFASLGGLYQRRSSAFVWRGGYYRTVAPVRLSEFRVAGSIGLNYHLGRLRVAFALEPTIRLTGSVWGRHQWPAGQNSQRSPYEASGEINRPFASREGGPEDVQMMSVGNLSVRPGLEFSYELSDLVALGFALRYDGNGHRLDLGLGPRVVSDDPATYTIDNRSNSFNALSVTLLAKHSL